MGFDFDACLFYGFVDEAARSEEDLWRGGRDVVAGEGYSQRLRRRLEVLGYAQDDLPPHVIATGQHVDEGLKPGPAYVCVQESYRRGQLGRSTGVCFDLQPEWHEQLRLFCDVMEIAYQEPGWHWFTTAS